jgi:hypothetical protein
MSTDEDTLFQWIRDVEQQRGRPFSDKERASILKAVKSVPANNPFAEFTLRMMARQGTKMPDFTAF